MIRTFFSNRSINFLILHYGLQTFANGIGDIFVGVYLYQRDIPLWMIFAVWGSSFIVRLVTRPLFIPLCFRLGLRRMLILGTFSYFFLFLVLGKVTGVNIWLLVYSVVAAVIDNLYWFPYHTYFSLLGDLEHRGKQIALREAVSFIALFFAPLGGAIIINDFGFQAAFLVGMTGMLLAVFPLLFTSDVSLPERMNLSSALRKIQKEGFFLYCGDALFSQAHGFTWKIVLFAFVGNYLVFGGLMSLAVLFQILGVLVIGHLFDQEKGKRLYLIGIFFLVLVMIGRALYTDSISFVIFSDVLFMIGSLLFYPVMLSVFYNEAKKSHHALYFQLFAESGWDIGSIISCFCAALFLYFGGELRYVLFFGIPGLLWVGQRLSFVAMSKKTNSSSMLH